MILEILKYAGHKALWVACFFCIGSGVFGTIIILKDTIKQGAYVPITVLLHSSLLVAGYFLFKELTK